jgi:hypothetical protein
LSTPPSRYSLKNSLGFDGHNATLVTDAFEKQRRAFDYSLATVPFQFLENAGTLNGKVRAFQTSHAGSVRVARSLAASSAAVY